jgi:alcohol dehydrogenase class IV
MSNNCYGLLRKNPRIIVDKNFVPADAIIFGMKYLQGVIRYLYAEFGMQNFRFDTTQSIIFERGASKRLGELAREYGIRRVFFVTDPGIYKSGLADAAQQSLRDAGVEIVLYCDVQADPPESVVLAAVARARDEKIDGVIGFGGGSSMDVAKLIAVLSISSQALQDIYGIGKVYGARLPLIQVPTTAGTGSEVTPISIITTGESTKSGVVSKQLLPDLAILDAELTMDLPPMVTAATGIDAMVHAIEAFTTKHKKISMPIRWQNRLYS